MALRPGPGRGGTAVAGMVSEGAGAGARYKGIVFAREVLGKVAFDALSGVEISFTEVLNGMPDGDSQCRF